MSGCSSDADRPHVGLLVLGGGWLCGDGYGDKRGTGMRREGSSPVARVASQTRPWRHFSLQAASLPNCERFLLRWGLGRYRGDAGPWVLKKGAYWVASRRCYPKARAIGGIARVVVLKRARVSPQRRCAGQFSDQQRHFLGADQPAERRRQRRWPMAAGDHPRPDRRRPPLGAI